MEGKTTRRAALGALGVVPAAMLAVGADGGTARAQAFASAPQPPSTAGPVHTYGVDVRREGAVGDGTTDDAPAFTRAFETASADGGNLVIVPPGTYRIAAPLAAQAPVHLTGIGGEAGSILRFDTGLPNGLTIAPTAETYPGPPIEISGLYFDYSGPGAALLIDESAVTSVFHDTRITGCRFHVHSSATGFASVNQRSILVADNQFLGTGTSGGTGVSVSDSDNTMITNNVFYDIQTCVHGIRGVQRVFNAGCMIVGNSMSGSQKSLFFENWEAIQAIGNMLDGSATNVVHLVDCYNSVLTGNYLGQTGTGPALLIETSSPRGSLGQISFSGNFINCYAGASGTAAIAVHGVSPSQPVDQVSIANNTINNYPPIGISLVNAQNVLVSGNTLSRSPAVNGAQAVVDATGGANHIVGNIVDAPINADGDTVTGNFDRVPLP